MRPITKDELDIILEKHKSYLEGVDGGEKANLYDVNLSHADLHGANLSYANLYEANLSYANLYGANLSHADLHGANLSDASLSYANLSYDNLYDADLSGADLIGANLHGANLQGVDLSDANLSDANLGGANLIHADLSGTYLDEKEQCRKGVILKKPMMGYKKLADGSICVLSIPKGAVVFSINGSKCRTNKAKVLEGGGVSYYDNEFTYKKGKTYEIEDFNLTYSEECSTGIHFFKTRKEAKEHVNN